MAGAIEQIHVVYLPGHDRLLMRVTTSAATELRLWLTRRFVRASWPLWVQWLASDPAVTRQADPDAKRDVLSFQHEQAVSETKFTKHYQPPPRVRPVSQVPWLVTEVRAEPVGDRLIRLDFRTERGRRFQLTLGRRMIHSLCKLIAECAASAEWGLDLALAGAAVPAGMEPAKRTIN